VPRKAAETTSQEEPTYRRDNEEVAAAGGVENGLERASRCAGVVLLLNGSICEIGQGKIPFPPAIL
jgi:hypothetical protein